MFCPSTKSLIPYSCPTGFYQTLSNQIACNPCPAGFTCVDPSQYPVACSEGHYSYAYATSCLTCPAGYYCPSVSAEPVICPLGKWSIAGQSECQDCLAGFSCIQMNADSQVQCPTG